MEIVKGKTTWINIVKPTKTDVDYLKTLHDFHPIILDELLHLSSRAKIERYDTYLYLTYHFPVYVSQTRTSRPAEIDFLITPQTVITVQYENLEPITIFADHLSRDPHLKNQILENGGYIAYYLLQEINKFCSRQLRHIEQNVISITKNLFAHQEYEMLQRISYVKRDVLDYGVIVKPQASLLSSLREAGIKFWGENLSVYLTDVVGDHGKIVDQLTTFRETIESCEETNGQLLNAKTNAVMQRFTILAFLTFPLMLYTSVFSNDIVVRQMDDPLFFWLGFGTVLLITLIAIFIFKHKGLIRD